MSTGAVSKATRVVSLCLAVGAAGNALAQVDSGPRGGAKGAGGPFTALSWTEQSFFSSARDRFQEVDSVSGALSGETGVGLGPTFNANSCAACHAQPDVGGSSPHPGLGQVRRQNPLVALAALDRAVGQAVPAFIRADGPVREARFIRNPDGSLDGGVHALYTIAGRADASGC